MTTHKIYGKIANTPEKITKGLMFRKYKLKKNEGLLFDMGTNKIHSFWMKNTYIPLDVIFLNSKLRIVGFVKNTTPHSLESVSINRKSFYVLEVNGGFIEKNKIRVNDYVDYYTI